MPPVSKKNDSDSSTLGPRAAAKRAQILCAAMEVFVEEGFDLASMDRIAERAEASKRTVYNYFPSKEELFAQVVESLFGRWHARKQIAFDPERTVEEQLRDFARAKALHGKPEAEVGLTRVALAVYVRRPELAVAMMQRIADNSLERWLAEAAVAGAVQVDDPAVAAEVFWALAAGALFWPQLLGSPMDEATRERWVHLVVDTFLARYGVSSQCAQPFQRAN